MKHIPDVINKVRFNFWWDNKKVWALNIHEEEMPIKELEWHFYIPFWNTKGGYYDLKPIDLINNPEKFNEEFDRIMRTEIIYPIDIMFNKRRWLILDGLHRLVKQKILGKETIKVRKIPRSKIKEIIK